MEKVIQSFSELKVGDLVLIDGPIIKDDLCVVSSIIPTYKYPITEQSGRKFYNKQINGVLTSFYADQCGDTGNEMINECMISSSTAGDYTFRLDDEPIWNIRLIDKTHSRWDSKLSKSGKMMNSMLSMLERFF